MSANGHAKPDQSRLLSTTAPFGFDFDPLQFLIAYRELGCRSAQFYRNPEKPPSTSEALAIAASAGVPFDSIHGLFGAHIDPSSPDADHREQCLAIYDAEAQLALDLGVSSVVVHPSANRADYQPYDPGQAAALEMQRWRHFDDFARRLNDIGVRRNVTFLVENVTYVFPLGHNAIALARHVLAVGSRHVRMCFDSGHAHVTGDAARNLAACAPAIDYLHIHDNDGLDDKHLMPGHGTLNWSHFAGALDASALQVPCMLEVFYPVEQVQSLALEGHRARLEQACAIREPRR